MIKLIFENMGSPERNSEMSREITVEIQLQITPETKWEEFKTWLGEFQRNFPHLNFNHFDLYPEDDRLMDKLFKIRQSNMQGAIGTDELIERQEKWMTDADKVEDFWTRREKLVSFITTLTPSPEDTAKGKKLREKERRAYRPRLKDER